MYVRRAVVIGKEGDKNRGQGKNREGNTTGTSAGRGALGGDCPSRRSFTRDTVRQTNLFIGVVKKRKNFGNGSKGIPLRRLFTGKPGTPSPGSPISADTSGVRGG